MKKKLTIKDIAKGCGVSVSTVSRVINNSPSVEANKREEILAYIKEHDYHPSMAARAMVLRSSYLIGVIVPDITNPYFLSLITEIEKIAKKEQFTLVLCNTMTTGEHQITDDQLPSEKIEQNTFTTLLERQVDGIIVLGGEIDKEAISAKHIAFLNRTNKQVPIVVVGQQHPDCTCIFIERNLELGVTLLTNHLLALGKKNIAFFGGEDGVTVTSARMHAFKKQMALYTNNSHPLIVSSDYYAKDGYESMRHFLAEGNTLPEAIIAINDTVALGILRALADANITCPQDIAIGSCDCFPQSEYFSPRLTSIDQKNSYLGTLAINMLIHKINKIEQPFEYTHAEHTPTLLIRESCGAIKEQYE